jgi:hypothetical protein
MGAIKQKKEAMLPTTLNKKKVVRKRISLFNSCEKDMTCILHKIRVYNQV